MGVITQMTNDQLLAAWKKDEDYRYDQLANVNSYLTAGDIARRDALKAELNARGLPEIITPQFYQRGVVRVEWVQLGEGWNGECDPNDPHDTELLRFDVMRWRKADETTDEGYVVDQDGFVTMHDASYCTAFPANASNEQKMAGLRVLMERVYERAANDQSVKKICEELSWIDLSWVGVA